MILIYILILTVVAWSYFQAQKVKKHLKTVPSPKGYPIVGNLLDYLGASMTESYRLSRIRCAQFYPGPWVAWLGSKPLVFIYRAPHVEVILKSLTHTSSKGSIYKFIEPWLGQALLTASGHRWRSHRKLLTPAFHFKILRDFHSVIQDKTDILLNRLQGLAEKKEPFDFGQYINACTLDVICHTAMGINMNAQTDTVSEYSQAILDVTSLALKRQYSPWLHSDLIWNLSGAGKRQKKCLEILHSFTDQVIQERKKLREQEKMKDDPNNNEQKEEGRKAKAFLDLMLDTMVDGRPMSDMEIRSEVDTILFAGHDTSAANIAWTLFLIGNYPEIQDRVDAELDSIFQGSNRKCTQDDLAEMKYLEMCIKESLRLFPSAPRIGRLLEEDINLDGKIVPKDTTVIIHIHQLHRDPENFANPDTFDPDRFLPENISKRHPYSYVPFSAGPRNCIGQKFAFLEIKIVLSSILRRFRVVSMDKLEDIEVTATFIQTPVNGTNLRLEPRYPQAV